MRAPPSPPLSRAITPLFLALFGATGALWLDRPVSSLDSDAARLLGGVSTPHGPLIEAGFAALFQRASFDARVHLGHLVALGAWILLAWALAKRITPVLSLTGPIQFRTERSPFLLRWIVVALILASAPVLAIFHLGGSLLPLALLVSAEECDSEHDFAKGSILALLASLQGVPFALAALFGGVMVTARERSAWAALRTLAPGVGLGLCALPFAHDIQPVAFLNDLPNAARDPGTIDAVVTALALAGVAIGLAKRALLPLRHASELLVFAVVFPAVFFHKTGLLALDEHTARAAILIALARPVAAATAASFTLAGRDALAPYRRVFVGVAWLAFVARAGTDFAWHAREAFAESDSFRSLTEGLPPDAVVLVDDNTLFSHLVLARANGALPPSTTVLRWANEDPARLAAELALDDNLRPIVRDLMLRGRVDPRSLFDVARVRPVRTTASPILKTETTARLVPSGFFLRPIDEKTETLASARTPNLDEAALESTLASLRLHGDQQTLVEAHRLLCTETSVFAASGRRDLAARYCRLMAPAAERVRCSICPTETRISANAP